MKKEKGLDFLFLALFAFAGVAFELLVVFLESLIYPSVDFKNFSILQSALHWIITCIGWATIAYILVRVSKNKYNFDLFVPREKMQAWQWLVVVLGMALSTYMSYVSWGGFKIVREFQNSGAFKFVLQYIYYAFETVMFTLIIVFGQKAFELWFKNATIPYGGILASLTWGLGHILSKGDIITGILSAILGFLFGAIYLVVNKDIRKTYIILFLMFVL